MQNTCTFSPAHQFVLKNLQANKTNYVFIYNIVAPFIDLNEMLLKISY